MVDVPVLSLIIWLPIFMGLLLLGFNDNQKNYKFIRALALITSSGVFFISCHLYFDFNFSDPNFQFNEKLTWIPIFNIFYFLGVDGISIPLILLTTFFTPLVIIAGWHTRLIAKYYSAFLIMAGLMCGAFAARDAILFYFFWEGMLIPMFLIIGIWGGSNRINASVKFFLYTFLGSVLMLVAILYIGSETKTYDISAWAQTSLNISTQKILFLAFFAAFAVKVPMWPVHTWLPHAHVEAPTGGSVILAAIMLKMGGYGLLRFCLPIFPHASLYFSPFIIALSLIAIMYIGFVAITQRDMKRLIAYSSIAHMGFVTLGLFIIFNFAAPQKNVAIMAMHGAMIQMLSHGFISGALFLIVGVLYDRMHSRNIIDYGGVANIMPVFASFVMLFAMANVGLPGTSGFVGEFLVIVSSFHASFWVALIAASTLILAAIYTLWMYKRIIFGPVANESVAALQDINIREKLLLAILALIILFFGVYPKPISELMEASINSTYDVIANKLSLGVK